MPYLYLAAAILSEVIGTTAMKQSAGFTRIVPGIVTGIAYAIAFYCLSQALTHIPTGIAYATWSGVGIVLIAAIAWLFQGQKLDATAIAGMALIVIGVVVVNASANAPH